MVNKKIDLLKKTAKISLAKTTLGTHVARVCAAFDVSGSMSGQYKNGNVEEVGARTLGLAANFDDDGAIEIFSFGGRAAMVGTLTPDKFEGAASWIVEQSGGLQGSTYYADVINEIAQFYFGEEALPSAKLGKKKGGVFGFSIFKKEDDALEIISDQVPVYVLFVTDGDNMDKDATRIAIRNSSRLPMFIQFIGIGGETFSFLKELDKMDPKLRVIDNVGFKEVKNPASIDAGELYDILLEQYPGWVAEAKAKGILTG